MPEQQQAIDRAYREAVRRLVVWGSKRLRLDVAPQVLFKSNDGPFYMVVGDYVGFPYTPAAFAADLRRHGDSFSPAFAALHETAHAWQYRQGMLESYPLPRSLLEERGGRFMEERGGRLNGIDLRQPAGQLVLNLNIWNSGGRRSRYLKIACIDDDKGQTQVQVFEIQPGENFYCHLEAVLGRLVHTNINGVESPLRHEDLPWEQHANATAAELEAAWLADGHHCPLEEAQLLSDVAVADDGAAGGGRQ